MKRQNDRNTTGIHDRRQNFSQHPFHMLQFIIRGNSQCLKHASCRVSTSCCTSSSHCTTHTGFQFFRRRDRVAPVVDVGQFQKRSSRPQALRHESEKCLPVVSLLMFATTPQPVALHADEIACPADHLHQSQIHARDRKVDPMTVPDPAELDRHQRYPASAERSECFRITGSNELTVCIRFRLKFLLRDRQHHWISIEPNQLPGFAEGLEYQLTMTGRSDRSVKHREARSELQPLQHFTRHHRNVNRTMISRSHECFGGDLE